MNQDTAVVHQPGKKVAELKYTDTSEFSPFSGILVGAPSSVKMVKDGEAVLALPEFPTKVSETFIKHFDIAASLFLILLTTPLMLLTMALVKLTSSGPVLYLQKRVGQSGKIFTLYKFRTMIKNAEKQTGPILAVKDDDRVTYLGRILRRTRLDELPQLFNVLSGDMSLVGPRPERPYFVRRHSALQGVRLAVKPGITGLAQIRAFYDLKPEHKLKYDWLYIQRRSLLLNLYILLQTIPVIFLKRGW